ncbi:MAG: TonB family protein [Pseudomonadota bacterium]
MSRNSFEIGGISSKMTHRSLIALVPAAIMTIGLFTVMRGAIASEEISPPIQTVYELQPYLESAEKEAAEVLSVKPPRPDVLQPPPQVPRLTADPTKVDLSAFDYTGAQPADYAAPTMKNILPTRMTTLIDTDMRPLQPPVPVYPRRAAELGLEGICDVRLSVSPRGEPFDVQAECSDRMFEESAERAVKKVKFTPKIRDGLPVTVTGVVYPLEFRLEP